MWILLITIMVPSGVHTQSVPMLGEANCRHYEALYNAGKFDRSINWTVGYAAQCIKGAKP